jgi:SAM-dependent methyltransferase
MEEKIHPSTQAVQVGQCPVCFSANLRPMLEIAQIPTLCNVIWENKEEAKAAPLGDVLLSFCQNCGHVFNSSFDPQQINYNVQYENSLHFSPKFQAYATWLARYLVKQHDLNGKAIVEIGSGKGDFLRLLCEYGGNVGTGFDPSYTPTEAEAHPAMSFIREEYSSRFSGYQADLICSRHTLEHLPHPAHFIRELRQTIADRKRTVVFVEVPNLNYILRDTAVWDIIYEHPSYFSANSLSTLFTTNSFNVLNTAEAFGGQFLYIEAIPRDINRSAPNTHYAMPIEALENRVAGFTERSREKVAYWRDQLNTLAEAGKRIVIWGAGSKGISFLNMLHVQDEIPYVIDINPRKRNKFITGTGQQIVPPEFLLGYRPDVVIIMNPIYRQEIEQTLSDLGLHPELLAA